MSAKRTNRSQNKSGRKSTSRRHASRRTSAAQLDFIDAAARVFELSIEPAWKAAVEANLATTLQLAASFMEFPLPDDAEPAPIFRA